MSNSQTFAYILTAPSFPTDRSDQIITVVVCVASVQAIALIIVLGVMHKRRKREVVPQTGTSALDLEMLPWYMINPGHDHQVRQAILQVCRWNKKSVISS